MAKHSENDFHTAVDVGGSLDEFKQSLCSKLAEKSHVFTVLGASVSCFHCINM